VPKEVRIMLEYVLQTYQSVALCLLTTDWNQFVVNVLWGLGIAAIYVPILLGYDAEDD
jgi:hypothetical protein